MDQEEERRNEIIDIHYLDSGGTNNMNFSFVTHMSIPIPRVSEISTIQAPEFAFSADGSKFAMATDYGRVFFWDIRSKLPLKTPMEVHESNEYLGWSERYLQFSSGESSKEALVFVEVCLLLTF